MVAAFAVEVTLACHAEDENRRHMEALLLPTCPNFRSPPLPSECSQEEDGLGRIAHGALQGVFKEYSQGTIQDLVKIQTIRRCRLGQCFNSAILAQPRIIKWFPFRPVECFWRATELVLAELLIDLT